jgi:hypothetical protein
LKLGHHRKFSHVPHSQTPQMGYRSTPGLSV